MIFFFKAPCGLMQTVEAAQNMPSESLSCLKESSVLYLSNVAGSLRAIAPREQIRLKIGTALSWTLDVNVVSIFKEERVICEAAFWWKVA